MGVSMEMDNGDGRTSPEVTITPQSLVNHLNRTSISLLLNFPSFPFPSLTGKQIVENSSINPLREYKESE